MSKINSINNEAGSLTIDPGSSGDSFLQLDINSVSKFRVGIDDSDSDKFKISSGSALETNNAFAITNYGEVTRPLQPAFLAVLNSNISNITGDGTYYTVVWDTTAFDNNSDFDGTSTFTAPISGRYRFDIGICYAEVGASHSSMLVQLVTTGRTYILCQGYPLAMRSSDNRLGVFSSIITDMDAADTAYVRVDMSGSTKTVDLNTNGSTDSYCFFSGNLEC